MASSVQKKLCDEMKEVKKRKARGGCLVKSETLALTPLYPKSLESNIKLGGITPAPGIHPWGHQWSGNEAESSTLGPLPLGVALDWTPHPGKPTKH